MICDLCGFLIALEPHAELPPELQKLTRLGLTHPAPQREAARIAGQRGASAATRMSEAELRTPSIGLLPDSDGNAVHFADPLLACSVSTKPQAREETQIAAWHGSLKGGWSFASYTKEMTPMPTQHSLTTAIMRRVDQDGAVNLTGHESLALARAVLEHAVRSAGYEIAFDSSSAPDLIDYLTVTTTSGLEGAALGSGLGALVGLLVGRPMSGATIGAAVGFAAGAVRGVARVRAGWRVRAVRELDGTPSITIHALGAA